MQKPESDIEQKTPNLIQSKNPNLIQSKNPNSNPNLIQSKNPNTNKNQSKNIIIFVSIRGIFIRKDDLTKWYSEGIFKKISKQLTITDTKIIKKKTYTKKLFAYQDTLVDDEEFMQLSRFSNVHTLLKENNPNISLLYKNNIPPGNPIDAGILTNKLKLHDNQQVALDYLMKKIYNPDRIKFGRASCIFVMDTGLGKTYMGGAFIAKFAVKTLILTPNISPISEWLDMFKLNFPRLKIGQYHSKIKASQKVDADIMIMTINSALSDDFHFIDETISSHKYFQQFGAVVYDEIHCFPTSGRQEIFWRANFKLALALTATPDERADNMDALVSLHLGPIILAKEIPGFNVAEIKWNGEVTIIRYKGPPEYTRAITNKNGCIQVMGMHKQFISDPYRNSWILSKTEELYKTNRNIFIFSELRNHLIVMRYLLKKFLNLSAEAPELGTLMGGVALDSKAQAAEKSRVILITYSYGAQSISIAKMDTIILGTPRRRKHRQILGRILRRSGDPSIHRLIFDIVDYETSLKNQMSDRKKIYEEKGFTITAITIKYDKIKSLGLENDAEYRKILSEKEDEKERTSEEESEKEESEKEESEDKSKEGEENN